MGQNEFREKGVVKFLTPVLGKNLMKREGYVATEIMKNNTVSPKGSTSRSVKCKGNRF